MAAGLGTLLMLLFMVPPAMAQQPLVETHGLRGGRYVGSAAAVSAAPRLVGGLGYAFTEGVLDGSDRHHRAFSEIAAGYAPRQYVQLSLALAARYDAHRSDVYGKDSGFAFATAITTRHAVALSEALSLAGQLRLRFPASQSVVRGLSAVSPELSVLATQALAKRYELSGQVGYRFDRSNESIRDPDALSPADRLAASLSRFDAALLGALFAMPIGPVTASVEWSWEIATGASAPDVNTSPMRLRLAAQTKLGERYVPGCELGVSPSARAPDDVLARTEPRFWAACNFALVFDVAKPVAPAKTPAAARELLPAAEPVSVAVRIRDATGAPVVGARVTLRDEQPPQEVVSDENGVAKLIVDPARSQQITVTADGFAPYDAELDPAEATAGLALTLTRDLPEGEIKGKVRSLRGGRALRARIVVRPLGVTVETDAEGNFKLAVPPGQYQLAISAEGHEPQERPAQVERLGVTILVVDLRRAAK